MKSKPKFLSLLLCGLFVAACLVAPAMASAVDPPVAPSSSMERDGLVSERSGIIGQKAIVGVVGVLGLGLSMAAAFNRKDITLKRTKALPNGAAATTCDAIDTGVTSSGHQPGDMEFLITAPALGATPLPDAKTMKYAVVHSDNADLSGPAVLYDSVVVQTGAGGVGAAAAEGRFRLPSFTKRYVGVRATGSGSGDASGSSFTVDVLF